LKTRVAAVERPNSRVAIGEDSIEREMGVLTIFDEERDA
jgi:hypothetical protein